MLVIDGAHGEGGGQLVRTACALAAITGKAVRVFNIRAHRDPPGLAPQHVTAVRAVAELCAAAVEGLALRARELVFRPGTLRGGQFRFDVGTAGSVTLVLQAVLPAAFAGAARSTLCLVGGTDVTGAPPLDYLRFVFLPVLARMGLHAEIKVRQRGYYPRGGGYVEVEVAPGMPQPLVLESAGTLRGGQFRFDVGTAGSVTLVLQAVLPAAFAGAARSTLCLVGGTDVTGAPPLDYLRFVFLPVLARMGLHAEIKVRQRGYYPRGGGYVEVEVAPGMPQPLVLESAGTLQAIEGAVHVANLPLHIVERMQHTAERRLRDYPNVRITPDVHGHDRAFGPGGAIVLWARTANTVLGAGEAAQRGVPAERIAETASEALRAELETGATLDLHASDQVLLYCALARGASVFLARAWSSHAQTTAWLIEQFLPVRIRASAQGALTRVAVGPA